MPNFCDELAAVLNRHSKENGSNTPDFILADYLEMCLAAFDATSRARERWYGKELRIGGGVIGGDVTAAAPPAPPEQPRDEEAQCAAYLEAHGVQYRCQLKGNHDGMHVWPSVAPAPTGRTGNRDRVCSEIACNGQRGPVHDGLCNRMTAIADEAEARGAAREREACRIVAAEEFIRRAKYADPGGMRASEHIATAIAARGTRGEPGGEDVTK